ncbi:hypothetical protein V499_09385 [Pseudogymnoascus sp. VKM F-103]|nr:hypothetical protein V499_09385 [Pseudogymnoascus sp. VKM F-103]
MAPYAHTPGTSSSPITPPSLNDAKINLRNRELDLEKAELKSKSKEALLQCKFYRAKHNLDKAEMKYERRKADIEAKREKQKTDFEIMQRKMALEAERRRDDLELKYQKFSTDLKSEFGNQMPRTRPQLMEKLRAWKLRWV